MPMDMAGVATVLFTKCLKFDPAAAHRPDRDCFVPLAHEARPRRLNSKQRRKP
jgi:transketolase